MLKEPVPDALLVGASGGTVFLGVAMLSLATYGAIKKFINLRKQDAKDERDDEFRRRLTETVQNNSFMELEKSQIAKEEGETKGRAIGTTKVAPEEESPTKEEGAIGTTEVAPEQKSHVKAKHSLSRDGHTPLCSEGRVLPVIVCRN